MRTTRLRPSSTNAVYHIRLFFASPGRISFFMPETVTEVFLYMRESVICYDAKRVGRTQPAFWSFIGMCRDNGITVLDTSGTDLTGSVMGGVNGLLAEMDRDATVARLAAGKALWRGSKRVEGRWPYGEHPEREYDGERAVIARMCALQISGVSAYAIAKRLNAEGTRTRYGKVFTTTTVLNILRRQQQ
jgi:DNA invertase Pin-like site-specific DNA recombinase